MSCKKCGKDLEPYKNPVHPVPDVNDTKRLKAMEDKYIQESDNNMEYWLGGNKTNLSSDQIPGLEGETDQPAPGSSKDSVQKGLCYFNDYKFS